MTRATYPFPEAPDGDWIEPPPGVFFLGCCDCGLVHRMRLRIVRTGQGPKVQFWAARDATRTRRNRRSKSWRKT